MSATKVWWIFANRSERFQARRELILQHLSDPALGQLGYHEYLPWRLVAGELVAARGNQIVSLNRSIGTYGQDKVIFGTDVPVLDFERTVAEIDALGLREIPRCKLMCDNVLRVYGLES